MLGHGRRSRRHGLGLEYMGNGILILLPCGGGKTTLTLEILQHRRNHIRLISEDSPLVTKEGRLLPFPVRLGILPSKVPSGIDPAFMKKINRMEYDPKVTIDIQAFSDRLCRNSVKNKITLIGLRSTGRSSRIIPITKISALRYFLKNSVVGIGLYQGMEFIMNQGFSGLMTQTGILISRLRNNLRLAVNSRMYLYVLGRDSETNYETFEKFLKTIIIQK